MSWMFVDWFVPVYLLVSVLVLAGFGACLYFLEPGLQDAHKWSNKTIKVLRHVERTLTLRSQWPAFPMRQ
uniref:Uncharacterized protein n=1 Tax=Astyanax mexicanus TaxID=7994 RepID=A0A8B9GSL8_ASTMX